MKSAFILFILFLGMILLQNLGKLPLLDDEALRGLVSMEMLYSGDRITPTTAGEHYFNKPPLYNWILLFFFHLTGSMGAFVLRLPNILAIIGFATTLFFYLSRHYPVKTALFSVLFTFTTGRILFYESFYGLMDITFSWVVFFQIVALYEFFRQHRYREMFLSAYGLAAAGFLLKGMPVVAFQGITLLVLSVLYKRWKFWFSPWHFAGLGLFLLLVGSYFYAYHLHNPGMVRPYLEALVYESGSRTLFAHSVADSLLHLVTWPPAILVHFLPWSALLLLLVNPAVRRAIRKNPRSRFFLLAALFNGLIYWISPEIYPPYILMIVPLALTPLTHVYLHDETPFVKAFTGWFQWICGAVIIMAIPAIMIFNYLESFRVVNGLLFKTIAFMVVLTYLMFRFFKLSQARVYIVVIALMIARTGYNTIVTPQRQKGPHSMVEEESRRMVEHTRDASLYILFHPPDDKENYHGRIGHDYRAQFYLQGFKGEVIPVKTTLKPGPFYLVSKHHLKRHDDIEVFDNYTYHPWYSPRYLVTVKQKFAF